MQKKDRVTLRQLGALLLCLMISGTTFGACSSPDNPQPQHTITVTFACPQHNCSVYLAAADAFNQTNFDVNVRVLTGQQISVNSPRPGSEAKVYVNVMYQMMQQLAQKADTFAYSESGVEGGPMGLILDISSFIETDDGLDDADFLPGLLDRFRWQNGIWGLPAGVDPTVVFYSSTAFEREGLKFPLTDWTWDDLMTLAQQLTHREGGKTVCYGFADPNQLGARSAVEALGGHLADTSADPPIPMLDDPITVAALKWYTDLTLQHEVMLNPIQGGDMLGALLGGKVVMAVGNTRSLGAQTREEFNAVRVASLPGRSPVTVSGYFISAGTAHPEAAWRWLRFLSQQVAPPGELPARQELIPKSAYASKIGEETLGVLRYTVEHALPPVHPIGGGIVLDGALERVFSGEDLKDVMTEAQQQAVALFSRETVKSFVVPTTAPSRITPETITFLSSQIDPLPSALIQAFHEAHPEIELVVRYEHEFRESSDSFIPKIRPLAELIQVSQADCVLRIGWFSEEVQQAVLNLQPFIDTDPTFPLSDYEAKALEAVSYNGDLWGLPAGLSAPVLYYNRNLFDQAGLSYPQSGWTWDDFFAAARALTGGKGVEQHYGFVIWPHGWFRILDLLEIVGGDPLRAALIDGDNASMPFRFDGPEVVALAQQLARLAQDKIIPTPRQTEDSQSEMYNLVWSGRIGMWIDAATLQPDLLEEKGIYVAPLPKADRCIAPVLLFTYHIAAGTSHAEACWQWLNFLSNHTLLDSFGLPPRHSLLTADAFREQVGAEAQAVYAEALACENSTSSASDLDGLPYSGLAYSLLEDAVREILWQGVDAQAALNQAQQKTENYLNCLWQRPDLKDSEGAQVCFEAVNTP